MALTLGDASTGAARPVSFTPARSRSPFRTRTVTTPINVQALLASDPALRIALQQVNAQGVEGLAGLTGGEQQLYGRLGEAPDLNTAYFRALPPALQNAVRGAITPELQGVIASGNQAGLTTLAQLARGYQQTQANDAASLAARGLARSGAYGQVSNENLQDYTIAQNNARQAALDSLGSLQTGYLGQQNQLAGQAAGATSDALGRIVSQINAGTLAPTTGQVSSYRPQQNPTAPAQVTTPLAVGAQTSYEPKPTAGNMPKPLGATTAAPYVSFARQAR